MEIKQRFVLGAPAPVASAAGVDIAADNISATNVTTTNLAATNISAGSTTVTGTIDVTTFGAKGDGVTDNKVAIANAAAVVAANGGILVFPPGNFLTSGSLVPIQGAIFEGSGMGATQILYNGPGYWLDLGPTSGVSYFTLRDMRISCQPGSTGAIRVGSPSQDYATANLRIQWNLSNLYIFGPGQTASGTTGISVTQLIDHTISNFTVVQFETIAIIDRCQNGTWTRARFFSFTNGPLITNKAGTGTITPGGGSQDVFINPEFLGPTVGSTTGGDTVTVAAGSITFINALYEVASGFHSNALLHLVSSDGTSGAAAYFKDINGGFGGPGNAVATINFGNNFAAPAFIGTVVAGSGFPAIQFGTIATPGADDFSAKFINCSSPLNQLVQAANNNGKLATIFGGGNTGFPGLILTQSQVHDQTGMLRVVGVPGFDSGGPVSGRGINIRYFDPNSADQGLIQCYDQTNGVFKLLAISASSIVHQSGGTAILTIASGGMSLAGGLGPPASNPGMQHQQATTGSIPASTQVQVALTWSVPFRDTNYTSVCTVLEGTSANTLQVLRIVGQAPGSINVLVANNDTVAHTGTLLAMAMHF